MVCFNIDEILQSKKNLLMRYQTYGAPEVGMVCGRTKILFLEQGSLDYRAQVSPGETAENTDPWAMLSGICIY